MAVDSLSPHCCALHRAEPAECLSIARSCRSHSSELLPCHPFTASLSLPLIFPQQHPSQGRLALPSTLTSYPRPKEPVSISVVRHMPKHGLPVVAIRQRERHRNEGVIKNWDNNGRKEDYSSIPEESRYAEESFIKKGSPTRNPFLVAVSP